MFDLGPGNPHDSANMRARLLAGIVLSGALVASAQTNAPVAGAGAGAGARTMALQECLDLALSKNLDLQIEHLSADIAGYNLSGAWGVYVPNLSFGARHDFLSSPIDIDYKKSGQDYAYELSTDTWTPALSGNLPIGLSYDIGGSADAGFSRTDFRSNLTVARSFPPDGIRYTNLYLSDFGLGFKQHLLKDSWIDPYRETILLRRKDLKISAQALRLQVMKTALAVELGFYDLLAAREQIRVQEKALELRRQLVAETQRRVEVGDLPPLDSEQAQTQLQNTLTALAAAREAYVNRENALKSLFTDNFMEWVDVDLQPAGALLAIKADLNRRQSFQNAIRNRPDLAEARLAVEKSDVVVRFQKNQLFPNLDLVGRLGGVGDQADLVNSLSDTFHFRHPAYFYGVVVSFPLSNVAERNSYRASKAARQIANLQLRKAEQAILVEVADFINQAETRFTQVGSTRQARTFAQAAFDAEEKKLQNGLSTTFLVLQMQEALIAARTAEAQALADYNKALAQLAFAEGTTLDRHRLRIGR